jgi:PAS domain S-box-containing protein
LRESLSNLEELQEIAQMGNWIIDLNEGSMQWSHEMYINFGVIQEEFDLTLDAFNKLIHPDDKALMDAWIEKIIIGIKVKDLEFRIIRPDGDSRWIRVYGKLTPDKDGKPALIIGTAMDITERKKAEEEIRKNNAFIEGIINASPDLIYIYDIEKKINVYVNTSIQRYLGYSEKEIKNMGSELIKNLMDPVDYAAYLENILPKYYSMKNNEIVEQIYRMRKKNREWRWFQARESIYLRKEDGTPVQIFGLMMDITDRKKIEKEKNEIEERFKQALENIPDVIVIYDHEKRIQFINQATRQVSGRPISDFIGKFEEEVWPPEIYSAYLPMLNNVYITGKIQSVDTVVNFSEDDKRNLKITCVPILDEDGTVKEVIGITHDYSDQEKSKVLLRESENRYRLLVETSPYAICVHQDRNIVYVNPAAIRMLGAKYADELVGKPIDSIIYPEGLDAARDRIKRMLEGELGLYPAEDRYVKLDGSVFPVEITAAPFSYRGRPAIQVIALDLSEKKQAQEELANEAIRRRILIEQSQDGIVILDQHGRIQEANNRAAEMLGYTPEEFNKLTVWDWDAKFNQKELDKMLADSDEAGAFFETKHKRKDGSVFDVEISTNAATFAGEKSIFSVVRDITERKKAQQDLQNTLRQLRQAISTTIRVLIQAIESRDPYTAGHQRRVADLARSIAEEIHLTSEQIEGIRIAASIHDIGKISIPSEILSKPTRLSDIEMQLVREHAKNGYEILKDIESQWPIAEIVHQHHERMDGSGYPQGLAGEDILIEARILSVADVVEAMASHRPYRPALGIDAALDEIEKNKDILYDEQIVDACLKLFREGRFSFDEKRDESFTNY